MKRSGAALGAAHINPWDEARRRRILLADTLTGMPVAIDRGVNFFVRALSNAGARTLFSCEGHPKGFYVLFEAPLELAQLIRTLGFFTVELEGSGPLHPKWSIRLPEVPWTETTRSKRRRLRWAAKAWVRGGLRSATEASTTGELTTSPAITTNRERINHVIA